MPSLEIKALQVLQLNPFDLIIKSTDIIMLNGISGSGKSKILRAIADLDPHQGDIYFNNQNKNQLSAHQWRKKITLVPAESAWWAETVIEHFKQPPDINQLTALALTEKILECPVNRLSSGEKQRLSILRALAIKPQVLLLDEITANLDAENSLKVEHLILNYQQQNQIPILWVSHDLAQIKRLATKTLFIEKQTVRIL